MAAEITGTVLQEASAIFLARVVGADGNPIDPSSIESARYTVFQCNPLDPDAVVPVHGHVSVPLSPSEILFSELQRDPFWTVDAIGYNFRHEIDVSEYQAFPLARVTYAVWYDLVPRSGQIIPVRFRVIAR